MIERPDPHRVVRPPRALSAGELAAENISGFHWWRCQDIAGYRGTGLFSPRDLATPLAALLANGIPDTPVLLGNRASHPDGDQLNLPETTA